MQMSYLPSVKNAGKRTGNSTNQALQTLWPVESKYHTRFENILNKKMGSVEDCEENGRLKL